MILTNLFKSFILFQRLLEQLIIHRPDNPIRFFIQLLKRENDDGEAHGCSDYVLKLYLNLNILRICIIVTNMFG